LLRNPVTVEQYRQAVLTITLPFWLVQSSRVVLSLGSGCNRTETACWRRIAADRSKERRTMGITENPAITYPDAHLYCDRDGMLGMGTHVPDLMPQIAQAPWLGLSLAATGLALR